VDGGACINYRTRLGCYEGYGKEEAQCGKMEGGSGWALKRLSATPEMMER